MTEATTEIVEEKPVTAEATTETTADTGAATETTTEAVTTETTTTEKTAPPDNWRDLLIGGNDDVAKLINRYGSPDKVGKALLEKDKMIREGSKAKPIERPTDAADEKAWDEYRKAAGIPADPTGYKLPDNVTKALTDADKPVLATFTEFAHKKGMTPDGVAIATEWYVENVVAMEEAQNAADKEASDACEDAIRKEWAPAEYKGNINLATRFIQDRFGLSFEEFGAARLPDGRRIGDIPEFVVKLSDLGRENYGDAAFANSETAKRHDDRKAAIEKVMRDDIKQYFAEKLDVEYAEILKKEEARKK